MGLFNKNRMSFSDFSQVGIDLHSHLLPGLDDGSPSLRESLNLLREMERMGYRKAITTPHVISDLYPNTRERILGQLYHLKETMAQEGIQLELEASGEYHMDGELMNRIRKDEVIPFGKNAKYLLVELPFQKPAFSVEEELDQIRKSGYCPVLAHPERYGWLIGKMKLYESMKEQGTLFQLNLNSLAGWYGFPVKIAASQLIDADMIEFAGSDAHHLGQLRGMMSVLNNRHFMKLVGSGRLLNPAL
jgi:tyrosine-protein phosphatase YwqE